MADQLAQVQPPAGYRHSEMACWFTNPAAAEVAGRTWIGGVRSRTFDRAAYADPYTIIFADPILEGGHCVANSTDGEKQVLWRGTSDDHTNPALVMPPDRPPLVFIPDGHANRDYLVLRRGTVPGDLTTLGPEERIDFSDAGGTVSYAQVHHYGSRVVVLCRTGHTLPGPDTWWWAAAVSDDWGATWTPGHPIIHWGAQAYISSRQVGTTVHACATFHPDREPNRDQTIRYFSIDLITGDIADRDGTKIANLDGTDLPLLPSDLEAVEVIPSGIGQRTWTYDCLPDGSPVWVQWDQATEIDGGRYRSARWTGTSWTVSDITSCGARMDDRFPPPVVGQPYRGGAMADANGDLWLSREDGGTWSIERWTRTGDTWSHAETLASSSERRLVRPFVPAGRSTGPRVVWAEVITYPHYLYYIAHPDWEGNPASLTQGETPP